MCGLVGRIGAQPFDLSAAMATIRHRGPDDSGTYRFHDDRTAVDLGFLRLSILDLTPDGHQPMANEDGTIWLVFNGEIYNHRDLRDRLGALGHTFRSRTDSETILHAYEAWGDACVDHLRGMFGFAIWDSNRRRLYAARDRLGIKPFFWTNEEGVFAFSSEMKALLALGVSRTMDPIALAEYLRYLYVPRPRTIFSSISELPPGHTLTWEKGEVRVARYWDLHAVGVRNSDAGVIEELRSLLAETVRLHLDSDVPLGAFLSGGLDSSTLVALMSQQARKPIRTFCMTFGEGEGLYDERGFAQTVARHFGTEHTEIPVEPDLVQLLPQAVRHFDEPFGNPTALLTFLLSQKTREHVTVALAGDGGDEVFLGYPRYTGAALAGLYRKLPAAVRHLLAEQVAPRIRDSTTGRHGFRRAREFLTQGTAPLREMYENWIAYQSHAEVDQLLVSPVDEEDRFLARLFDACPNNDFIEQLSYVDVNSFLPNNLLHYTDRMSMAHSLEVRVPFCDHKLVEFMAAIRFRDKMGLRESKRLMRAAVRDLLPSEILHRKKLGFNPPMGIWLKRDLRRLVRDKLDPQLLQEQGIFRPESVQRMVDEYMNGGRDHSLQIFSLLVFQTWHELYGSARLVARSCKRLSAFP